MDAVRIQSKFLVASPNRCLHPGQLVIRHGRVVELTDDTSQSADIDLGETVLIPGLVNAHTHLEFSSLRSPFPAGQDFPEWISRVVRYRRELVASAMGTGSASSHDGLGATLGAGLRECFLSGTVLVGDIVTPPWQADCLPSQQEIAADLGCQHSDWDETYHSLNEVDWQEHFGPLSFPRVLALAELLGLSAEQLGASWRWACQASAQVSHDVLLGHGISPHAPYSIHFPTIQQVLAQTKPATLVAMHVAESPAELQWLSARSGPFHDLFERLEITVAAPPPSIDQCIELLSGPQRALLIHGNYLTTAQIQRVSAAPGITVVFCPRTHAHFGHAPYPLLEMLKAGLRLALGTDSRASNPDLSLWDEVVRVKRLYPQLAGSELLKWVTLNPAQALGVEHDFGSLEGGQLAHANAIRALPQWTADSLLDDISQRTASELGITPLSCLVRA